MKNIYTFLFALLFQITTSTMYAQVPSLVADINTELSSDVSGLCSTNGRVYFNAQDSEGRRPYYTSGTPESTVAFTGLTSLYGGSYTEYNGLTYFYAYTEELGLELWRTDNTASGTELFMEINPTVDDAIFDIMGVYNGKLYFTANDNVHGYEIWSTDGTVAGTQMLKDIHPTGNGFYSSRYVEHNGKMYFYANDGVHGTEFWVSDGTAAGTMMVKDMSPDSYSIMYEMISWNGMLYILAFNDGLGMQLWKSDGTTQGTQVVKMLVPEDVASYSSARKVVPFNGRLYFSAGNGFENILDMWSTDGTTNGTIVERENAYPGIADGNVLYYAGVTGDNYFGVYKKDTFGNEVLLATQLQALSFNVPASNFMLNDGRLYFTERYNDGAALYVWSYFWSSDGTPGGTHRIANDTGGDMLIRPGAGIIKHNGDIYFAGSYSDIGEELYRFTTPTSVQSVAEKNTVRLWPNPAKDCVRIDLRESQSAIVWIHDMQGRCVRNETIRNAQSIATADLPEGIYQVTIQDESDEVMMTRMVVAK